MMKTVARSILATGAATLALSGLSGIAAADGATTQNDMPMIYKANLAQLNGSGVHGVAYVIAEGNKATVVTDSYGLSADLPHAQHIHIGGTHTCPDLSVDANHDGLISVAEAAGNYGAIKVSLTTSGDVSDESGLAVDRFPIGGANGETVYERSFTLPAGVTAQDLGKGVIVQHGIASLFDSPKAYDGTKVSSIDPSLPLEATIPADCGTLQNITPQISQAVSDGAAFDGSIEQALEKLDMTNDGAAQKFAAMYAQASQQFASSLQTAAKKYEMSMMAGHDAARDQYMDSFNNAKAVYLNQLEMARNTVVDSLTGTNDVAKDNFVNSYNQARDTFSNQLETLKNQTY